jgi:hypothetical protein
MQEHRSSNILTGESYSPTPADIPGNATSSTHFVHGLPGSPTLSDFLCLSSDFPEVSQAVACRPI